MKPIKTCILVADGAHSRVYLNEGPGKGITELKAYAREIDLRPNRQIEADRPGRTFDSGGEGRHAMESPTEAREHEKREFHRDVAEKIAHDMKQGAFDRLVLVAPPATLGDLRQEFGKIPGIEIHAEIAKDMVHSAKSDLLLKLGDVVAV